VLIQAVLSAILAMSISGVSPRGTALVGRISDGDTPVSGAIVTISNRGFVKSTTTDGNGRFMLEPIPSGRYDFRTSSFSMDPTGSSCPN
jgi:Carboxypeptidase regulatory-like domain